MDENILFSYELNDAWFLPITGVDVYKTGEVRCMTDDKDATSILDEKALAEIENVIESHPELFEYESPEIATPTIFDGVSNIFCFGAEDGRSNELVTLNIWALREEKYGDIGTYTVYEKGMRLLQVFDMIAGILTRNGVPSECLALR
jgi:hypothetical protein